MGKVCVMCVCVCVCMCVCVCRGEGKRCLENALPQIYLSTFQVMQPTPSTYQKRSASAPSKLSMTPSEKASFTKSIYPPSSDMYAAQLHKILFSPSQDFEDLGKKFSKMLTGARPSEYCLTSAAACGIAHALQSRGLQNSVCVHQPFLGIVDGGDDSGKATADMKIYNYLFNKSVAISEAKRFLNDDPEAVLDQVFCEIHHLRHEECLVANQNPEPKRDTESNLPILVHIFDRKNVTFYLVIPTHRKDPLARPAFGKPTELEDDNCVFVNVHVGTFCGDEDTVFSKTLEVMCSWAQICESPDFVSHFGMHARGMNRSAFKLLHPECLQLTCCTKKDVGILDDYKQRPFYAGPTVSVLKPVDSKNKSDIWVFKEFFTDPSVYGGKETLPREQPSPGIDCVPPSSELLAALIAVDDQSAEFYKTWQMLNSEASPESVKILKYRFMPGIHNPPSLNSWIKLIRLVQALHERDLVHCDILPQNMVFSLDGAFLIDFDFVRKDDSGMYPINFNCDFEERYSRHLRRVKTEKKHDIHSLWVLTRRYFKRKSKVLKPTEFNPEKETAADLIAFLEKNSENLMCSSHDGNQESDEGSPKISPVRPAKERRKKRKGCAADAEDVNEEMANSRNDVDSGTKGGKKKRPQRNQKQRNDEAVSKVFPEKATDERRTERKRDTGADAKRAEVKKVDIGAEVVGKKKPRQPKAKK